MSASLATDLRSLDAALNELATLYQLRRLDDRAYRTITVSQWYCLRLLALTRPRAMSELSAGLDIRISTMTGVVDQLEEKGLVTRVHDPDDRRSLRVDLTSKGRRLYETAHAAFLFHLEPLFKDRSPGARREILAFLGDVLGVIHGWRQHPRRVPRRRKRGRPMAASRSRAAVP